MVKHEKLVRYVLEFVVSFNIAMREEARLD